MKTEARLVFIKRNLHFDRPFYELNPTKNRNIYAEVRNSLFDRAAESVCLDWSDYNRLHIIGAMLTSLSIPGARGAGRFFAFNADD